MSTPSIATEDLSCAECGYDLRTLPSHSNCAECGRAIEQSASAPPVIKWLARFRRGVVLLFIAMLAATPLAKWWVYDQFVLLRINPEGALYFTYALLFLPAAWFMTGPAHSHPHNPNRFRKWLIGLTAVQLVLGLCAITFSKRTWPFNYFWGCAVLMTAYALMPLTYVAVLWLLLELLYRALPMLRNRLPRVLFRAVQSPLIYSIIVPAIVDSIVCVVRITVDNPPDGNYLGKPLSNFLDHYFILPAMYLQLPIWLAFLLIILHCIYRLLGPIALPPRSTSKVEP